MDLKWPLSWFTQVIWDPAQISGSRRPAAQGPPATTPTGTQGTWATDGLIESNWRTVAVHLFRISKVTGTSNATDFNTGVAGAHQRVAAAHSE